ncbi:hypothetical protein EDM54_24260 [Brevibacillus borstelensis]|uniref:hypothetical protein n=1 Tax=Brevibacillus borstelensis TaxID=45462 RepID=UPI000F084562|nr:hypothetical protein [Brevibacillus borstelensis]MED1881994.1 hypothetical protein [Brevibacillus borstelensis]RNB56106.1 hypothetical protein EDM54_24260 [Brevibacillus borstelensis]GED55570.1 hypothetical protein BBO01nite_48110 [Brevibacillus borstelensis]
MNTKETAMKIIVDFLVSEDKCLYVNGTHQFKKHSLVLGCLKDLETPSTILFRTNAMKNLGAVFGTNGTQFKTGVAYPLGKHKLYFDSLNPTSQRNTPRNLDYVVVYPIDSACKDKKAKEIIQDVFHLSKQKVFLVSWTDVFDDSLIREYVDRYVTYDAEEDDPAYHQRVLELHRQRGKL